MVTLLLGHPVCICVNEILVCSANDGDLYKFRPSVKLRSGSAYDADGEGPQHVRVPGAQHHNAVSLARENVNADICVTNIC